MIPNFFYSSIERGLKQSIYGQEDYVNFLALYGYKIILFQEKYLPKKLLPLPLIVGPSGSGKTFGIKTLCDELDIPLYIIDGSSITKAGYKGNDVSEAVISTLTGSDSKKIRMVFIDEIDKCNESYREADINQGIVYSDFLKIMEGNQITSRGESMDISNVIFAFGGSFGKINQINSEKIKNNNIGNIFFTPEENGKNEINDKKITKDELHKFGLNYEFLGRITDIIETKPINKDEIPKIMASSKSVKEICDTFFSLGTRYIYIDDKIFEFLANKVTELNMGMREVENILTKHLLDIPLTKFDNINFAEYINVYMQLIDGEIKYSTTLFKKKHDDLIVPEDISDLDSEYYEVPDEILEDLTDETLTTAIARIKFDRRKSYRKADNKKRNEKHEEECELLEDDIEEDDEIHDEYDEDDKNFFNELDRLIFEISDDEDEEKRKK